MRKDIRISAAFTARVNVELEVGQIREETITVTDRGAAYRARRLRADVLRPASRRRAGLRARPAPSGRHGGSAHQ